MKKLDFLIIPHLVFFKNNIFLFVSHAFIWKQHHLWMLLIFWSSIKKENQVCFRFDHFRIKLNFLMHYSLDTSKNTIKLSSWTYLHNCRICEWESGLWIRVYLLGGWRAIFGLLSHGCLHVEVMHVDMYGVQTLEVYDRVWLGLL